MKFASCLIAPSLALVLGCPLMVAQSGAPPMAPPASAPALLPSVDVAVMNDIQGPGLQPYLEHLVDQVQRHWKVPADAGASGRRKSTTIELAIAANGSVTEMHLLTTPHDHVLDPSAWEALKSSKFAALPPGLGSKPLRLQLRFVVG